MSALINDIIESLKSADFQTRIYLMDNLRKRKDPKAVPALVTLLQADGDHRIREEAAYSLESLGDARAVEPLNAALMDINADVRLKAARALGAFKDARAVEPLCISLRDPDQVVRGFAARALGKIGDRKAIEPLRTALQNTSQPEARQAIESVLKDFNEAPPTSDVTFSCPSCAQNIACDESYRGHQVQCPTCQADIAVPPASTPPPLPSVPEGWSQDNRSLESNAWRSGDTIVVKRGARPGDQHCVDCGAPCESYETLKLDWLEPWKVLLIVLFSGLVLAPLLFMALSTKASIELPMCGKCMRTRKLLNRLIVWFIIGGFAAVGLGITINGLLHMETLSQILGLSGLLVVIAGIGIALVVKTGLKTTKIDAAFVWLQIRGSQYASRLPHWRG